METKAFALATITGRPRKEGPNALKNTQPISISISFVLLKQIEICYALFLKMKMKYVTQSGELLGFGLFLLLWAMKPLVSVQISVFPCDAVVISQYSALSLTWMDGWMALANASWPNNNGRTTIKWIKQLQNGGTNLVLGYDLIPFKLFSEYCVQSVCTKFDY